MNSQWIKTILSYTLKKHSIFQRAQLFILAILALPPLPRDASPSNENPTEIAVSKNDNGENSRRANPPETSKPTGDKQDLSEVLSRQIMHNASSTPTGSPPAGNYVVTGSVESKTRRKRASRRPRKFKILPALCG
ncbi:hypothetical protein JTB14_000016 [Gonioctena quinquepunctata]|nr:hypothetical protein JTB14_000016 [Gonioctena quinquepunctata]